jgi:deoxyxylulose-5-phosphate synthase
MIFVKLGLNLDALIYSPTIESGCNMDVKDVFDNLFVIFSDGANSQRSLFQQMGRVRYFKDNIIHMLNDNKFTFNENRNYWTFQQVMSTINHIQSQRVIIDGQVKVIQNQEFTINYAYQRVEELNKCKNLFLNSVY